MNTLAGLQNHVVTTLQLSPLCNTVHIVETQLFSKYQFAFRVRADLVSGETLQIRLYVNSEHIDYAYQLIRYDRPVLRWEDKEHFPSLPTYPHHFHNTSGQVEASQLNGNPSHDLISVLSFLESNFD